MPKFVTIHTFINPIEAEIVKAKLESEGIHSFILDQNLAYTVGPTTLQGFRLQVEQDNILKAKQILEKSLQDSE